MSHLSSRVALMGGNFITGISILAPAGMLTELSQGLNVTIRDAGLLVTYGAAMLCVASPVMSWLTTRLDRRLLMTGTLVLVAAGHVAAACASSYAMVLALRIVTLAFVSLYTPQAASTVSLIVPDRMRARAISFVFLGWSMAIAVGLPLITFLATTFGWRETYAVIGVAATAVALLNAMALPGGLKGHPLSLHSFVSIAQNRALILILLVTLLQMSGMFAITIYMAAVLAKFTAAGPNVPAVFFSLLGGAGIIGNLIATSVVGRLGVQFTLGVFISVLIVGGLVWAFGAGDLIVMGAGIALFGLGVASANSMQQARLVMEAPELASATVALNTSVLYVGQATGSGIAGILFANEYYRLIGFVAVSFFVAAFILFLLTAKRSGHPQ